MYKEAGISSDFLENLAGASTLRWSYLSLPGPYTKKKHQHHFNFAKSYRGLQPPCPPAACETGGSIECLEGE